MRGQNLLRRLLGHAGETGLAARQPHPRGLREPKRVVTVHEHAEHDRPADDRDRAATHLSEVAGGFEGGSRRIPQDAPRIGRIALDRADRPGQDDSLSKR